MKPETLPSMRGDALLTDLYQLTMAFGYLKAQTAEQEAVFHLFFRTSPFGGGFTVACGLAQVVEFLRGFRFNEGDLTYLEGLRGNDGQSLFESSFLDYLRKLRFTCDIDAVPEGTLVFPQEPLLRIRGPILQCQLLESALLNMLNFESLIATKAARICIAAQGEPVVEFGLRRAQGLNGALTASRAAYIGGCTGTSNLLAGKVHGIPVKGTHAHSWVMSFQDEQTAFHSYAEALPNNCVFLVDTYDTLEGVRRAIGTGRRLRERGHEMIGIRLDSGDLAYLSIEARKLLDAAGFTKAVIVATNDLDEYIIASLKEQGAKINVWGVGTRLVTAYDQPALGGVYKLSAIRKPGGEWDYKLKLSEQSIKTSNPGIHQVRRFRSEQGFVADAIYDCQRPLREPVVIVDPHDPTRQRSIPVGMPSEDLLVPVFRQGRLVYKVPSIEDARQRTMEQLQSAHPGMKRFVNPHQYPVGLELGLHELKTELILKARTEHSRPDQGGHRAEAGS